MNRKWLNASISEMSTVSFTDLMESLFHFVLSKRRKSVSVYGVFFFLSLFSIASAAPSPELLPTTQDPYANKPPVGYIDRSGLRELVFWQAVNGMFAGGFLSSALTIGEINKHCLEGIDQNDACGDAEARAGGIAAVGLASGIALPYWLTRGKPVTTSDAITINRATLLGAIHSYIIPFSAGLEPMTDDPNVIELNVKEIQWSFGLTFAGDLLGVGAGVYLAQNYEPDPGFVSLLGTLHFTTFLAAGSIGSAFADELDQDTNRRISGTSLAMADIALAAAYYYRNEIDIDRNRVFWIDTGSMVGWIAGGGIGAIIAGTDQRAVSIGSTIGMATGIIATYWATRKTEDWRNRVDFENTANKGFHFEAPSLSIRPRQRANGSQELTYFVDLWGSF